MSRLHIRMNAAKMIVVHYVDRLKATMPSRPRAAGASRDITPGLVVRHSTVRTLHTAGGRWSGMRLPSFAQLSRRTVWVTLALCIAFYAAARIGLALHFPGSLVYFVWPPSVLIFVALVLSPRQDWWVFFVALLPVHLFAEWGTVAAHPAVIALFYLPMWAQALAGALCVRRFTDRPLRLDTVRQLIIFLFSGVVVASVTEAITLAIILTLTTSGTNFWLTIGQTTLADALTMVVLAPALVSGWVFARRLGLINDEAASVREWLTGVGAAIKAWGRTLSVSRVIEASLLAIGLFGVALLVIGNFITLPGTLPALLYTLLPLLLWSAMRFSLGGTSLALCGLTLMSILYAIHGSGPFARFSTTVDLFSLQMFFIAISVPVLVLAVLMRERSEAEASLHESEARFRDLVESQSDMICRYLPDSTLTFVNEAYCRHYGKSRQQLVGTKFFDLMDAEGRDYHARHITTLLEHSQESMDEHRITLPNGRIAWQQWIDHIIRDDNGNVFEIQSIGRDITDTKQAEVALQESEARFRAAFESATTGMMLIDTSGRTSQVNRPLADMLGYSQDELLTYRFTDLTYPDDLNTDLTLFQSSLTGEIDGYQLEKRFIHKQGHLVWAHVSAGVVRDASGQPRYLIGQMQDITERKHAEEALRASEQRYRTVVNNFPRGMVLLFDHDLRHTFADGQGLPDIGLSKSGVVGKTIWQAFATDLSAALAPKYQAALAGTQTEFDLTFAGHTYQTQVLPIEYDETASAGMAILQDVTEQRQAEVLAELDRAKTAFLSNVSHEFRTPLTLLVGPAADALADRADPLPPRQRQRMELIQHGALRLLKLVNSLLGFSRVQAGHIQPNFAPTDVATLTADLASSFRSAAERAGLRLVVECAPLDTLPRPVYVDRDMWEQIVLNLISNALKFTLEGEIRVIVRTAGEQDDLVQLEVRDMGTGIPAADLPHLFERFYRVQNAARMVEGTGIGLALVQELVRLHGGKVEVSSVLDVGSAFTVTIPTGNAHLPADRVARREYPSDARIRPVRRSDMALLADKTLEILPEAPSVSAGAESVAAAAAWDERASDSQPRFDGVPGQIAHAAHMGEQETSTGRATILVADDNADMRAYLARLLSERWEVRTVADGWSALDAAINQPPDLILADVIMPGLDGFALIAALRDSPHTYDLPVILLSARAGEEATVEGLQAGADDYLIKPFSARELLARVQTHLELARVRRESEARAAQLDAIFEAIGDGVLVHDLQAQTLRANHAQHNLMQRHLEMLGHHVDPTRVFALPAEREQHITVHDERGRIISLEDWPTERALRGETLTGANAVDEFTQGANGEILQLNVSAAPIRNASGQITGAVAVFRDVTKRRQLERQVAEQASQLEAIFAAQADGVAVFDLQGRYLRANQALNQIFGMEADAGYLTRSLSERMARVLLYDEQGKRIPEAQWPHRRVLRGESLVGASAMDARLATLDGRNVWINITGAPIHDPNGQLAGVVLVTRDVTVRRELERQVVEQERRFRTLVENSPDIISRFDRNLRHLYVSPASEAVTGIPADSRLGKTYAELGLSEAVYAPWEAALRTVFATGQTQTFETRYLPEGQAPRVSRVTYSPEFADDGSVESVLGITTDITALKQTEDALRQSEERFSTAFHASPIGLAIIALADDRILDVNAAETRLTGYSRDEMVGSSVGELDLIAPADIEALRQELSREARIDEARVCVRTKSGEVRSCLCSVERIRVGSDECLIVTTRDVTQRERAEEALKRQERQFRTLVENSPNIIARFDRDLRYLYINPAIANIALTPPEQYLGKTNQELGWPEALYAPAQRAVEQVFRTGESITLLEDDAPFAQVARFFRSQFLPELAEDGTVDSVLTVTTEITDLKRAEEALRGATAAAEAAQREEERRRREAERREEIAGSLRDVLTVLNSDRHMTKVLDYITRQAGRLLSSDATAIYMMDFDAMPGANSAARASSASSASSGSLALQAAFGLPAALTSERGKRRLNVGDAAMRRAMIARRPVAILAPRATLPKHIGADRQSAGEIQPNEPMEHIRQASDEASEYIEIRAEALPRPYRALLAIPIVTQGQAYGSLLLLYTAPHHFSAEEVALAMAYGDQIALAVANAHLQEHIERAAAEAERNRLARDLHDTVTQEIFTASVLTESIPRVWERHRDKAEASLRQVNQLTRSALAALRALLLELRPVVLEQKTLDDLLRQLGEVMTMRSGVPIAVTIAADCPPLPIEVKVAFYRIAQEALTNAAKYANAHTIAVRLRSLPVDGAIQLDVQDDGQGFEAATVPAGHFGLGTMRERARAAGATLRITSRPDHGTHITVKWAEKDSATTVTAEEYAAADRARGRLTHDAD